MLDMYDRRGIPDLGQVGSASYYDYQESRLAQERRVRVERDEALGDPATDGFIVQVVDDETAAALQQKYFSSF